MEEGPHLGLGWPQAPPQTPESRRRDLNSQPQLYESCALPLSYVGETDLYSTAAAPACKPPISAKNRVRSPLNHYRPCDYDLPLPRGDSRNRNAKGKTTGQNPKRSRSRPFWSLLFDFFTYIPPPPSRYNRQTEAPWMRQRRELPPTVGVRRLRSDWIAFPLYAYLTILR
jgi:hypothetical protein